jgi:predicted nucleic acid-binding protein
MHLQVYIDTNIYLGLLARTSVVTDEMTKLVALCENGSIDIYLPQHTEEEYLSNREDVIARTAEELRKSASIGSLHPLVESHEVGDEAKRLRRELSANVKLVEASYVEAAGKRELPFDSWFASLKRTASYLPTAPALLERAGQRAAAHLPPGKGEALGDRLIWESLLDAGTFCEDLHLITGDDRDYRCPLNRTEPRRKLQDEWADSNLGKVHLYSSIDEFLSKAGNTERFARATELGRAIWMLRHHSEEPSIDVAMATLRRYIVQLSMRQIRLVASAARAYYDRVFLTCNLFDEVMAEFWRHYAKNLDDKERKSLSPVLIASGETSYSISVAANSN